MTPAYVLHHPSSKDRVETVADIIKKTGATVVQSCLMDDRKMGCRSSHILTAKLARSQHPASSYLIFEDDCVLSDDWQKCIEGVEFADVVYLGYNDKSSRVVYGTHALLISPKARDLIIEWAETYAGVVENKGAYDHILSLLCREKGLLTCMPPPDQKERWAWQKKGLPSLITGRIR